MKSVATVYLVTNKIDGNTYIGVTRFTSAKRWKEHIYKSGHKPKTYLHRAIAKYGADNFIVTDIASCLFIDSVCSVEQDAIKSFSPAYNQTNGGEFTTGRRISKDVAARIAASNRGKKRTEEQNTRMSEIKELWFKEHPEWKAKFADQLKTARLKIDQVKRLEAIRKAGSEGRMSRPMTEKRKQTQLQKLHSPEARAKSAKTRQKPVECVSLNAVFDSLLEAAKMTGIHFSNISMACLGKRKTAGGMLFRYI